MDEVKFNSRPMLVLLLSLAAIFIIAWGIRTGAAILNPILLATVITIVVLPLPAKLAKRGLPGWLSFLLTLVAVIGGLALVALLIFLSINQISADIAGQADVASAEDAASVEEQLLSLGALSYHQVQRMSQWIVATALNGLVMMGMVLLIFIFMLSAGISMPSAERLGIRPDNKLFGNVSKLTADVRRYMSIVTSINFFVGLGDVLLLWALDVPYALLWGLISWLMGYIPTVGFWLALIPPTLVAWQTQGVETAVLVFLGYVLINGTVQNFVQPRMMGQGLGISPVVVFISLFVWGWLLGGVGAILAVPLTLLIIAILDSSDNTRFLATLMSVAPGRKQDDDQSDDQAHAQQKLGSIWKDIKDSF